MKIHRWFLMSWITLISSTVFSPLSFAQENLPTIIKKIQPSVVVILTYNKEGELLAQGSGFFISKEGDVITNRHVLQGANSAEVKTHDGKVYAINKVIAEDMDGDLIKLSVDISYVDVAKYLGQKKVTRSSYDALSEGRRAGYTDKEIAEYLAKEYGYDLAGARKDGYTYTIIAEYLAERQVTKRVVQPLSITHLFPEIGERIIVIGSP